MIALIMICNFHSVCLFLHADHVANAICSGPGTVSYGDINGLGLNDELSSAIIPTGLQSYCI